jgi:Flp pilus assembly protein TadG
MNTVAAPHIRKNRLRSLTRKRRVDFALDAGQSLLELALVLPMLLVLLVGTIEIGRFAYYSILVANAARAGAQYGAQSLVTAADNGANGGIVTAAKNDGQNVTGLTISAIQTCGCTGTVAALSGACPAAPPCTLPEHALVYVEVTATGNFNSLFNYPGLPGTFAVTSREKMRVAQ